MFVAAARKCCRAKGAAYRHGDGLICARRVLPRCGAAAAQRAAAMRYATHVCAAPASARVRCAKCVQVVATQKMFTFSAFRAQAALPRACGRNMSRRALNACCRRAAAARLRSAAYARSSRSAQPARLVRRRVPQRMRACANDFARACAHRQAPARAPGVASCPACLRASAMPDAPSSPCAAYRRCRHQLPPPVCRLTRSARYGCRQRLCCPAARCHACAQPALLPRRLAR